MPTGKPITAEQEKAVAHYYISSIMSIKECADHFGLSCPTIIKILDHQNIRRYKKAILFNRNLNEHFFEVINTEEKAYFLGLIIADGNVFINHADKGNRQASISITVNEKDAYILQRFLDATGASTSIGHDGRGACTAAVRSDVMFVDLSKCGIIPSKSFFTYLPAIPEELYCHLIRGIFDGDGSIQAKPNKNKFMHALSFCGTHDLMTQISVKAHELALTQEVTVYDYKNRVLSELKYQAMDDIFKIGNWMYREATLYLERKKQTFNTFVDYYNAYHTMTTPR